MDMEGGAEESAVSLHMAHTLCWYHLYISGRDESKGLETVEDEFNFRTRAKEQTVSRSHHYWIIYLLILHRST